MTKKKDPLIDTAAIERATRFDATIFLGTGRFRTESFGTLAEAREAAIRFADEVCNGRKGMVYAITLDGRSVFVPTTYHPTMKENDDMATKTKSAAAMTGLQIAQLTAMITGGGFKRANSLDAAIKRFQNVAEVRGIDTKRILGAASFDQAKTVLTHSLKTSAAKEGDTPAPKLSGKGEALAAIKGEPKAAPTKPAKPKADKQQGKRAAILEAAQRGELPEAPDFSANTHKPHRKKLEQVVELVKAGDIAALKAFHINPVSSSPKAIDKYRNLAVIALEAQFAA